MSGIRVLDLYCGMGGLSLGFALALGAGITGLDIDRWAVETYNLNLARFGCKQSFPDWWRFPDGCSVSKRYKLVGEAVPPILAYRIAMAVGRTLGLEVRSVTKDEWPVPYFDRAF